MIRGNKGKAAFIVETGWRGMREASLAFQKGGFEIDILIKGNLSKDVLDLITKPSGKYRVRAIPRCYFRMYIIAYLLFHRIIHSLKTVVVSKERTRGWVRPFGFETKLLIENEKGYILK